MKRRAIFLILVTLPWAVPCSSAELSASLVVAFSNDSAQQLARSSQILQRRFSEFVGSRAGSATATIDQSAVVISLNRVAMSEADAKKLASLQGAFELVLNGRAVITDADIEIARSASAARGRFISLLLSKDAGQRLTAATRDSVGKTMSVVSDGRSVLTAPVLGEIGRELVFNAPADQTPLITAVALRYGRLPQAPVSVTLSHGT